MAIDLAATVEVRSPTGDGYRLAQSDGDYQAASAAELADRRETALIGLIAHELELPAVDLRVETQSPRAAGLGGSSALAAAAIAAVDAWLGREPRSASDIRALVSDLEARLMSLPTGGQDQLAAVLGGVLDIQYRPGGEVVRRLDVDLEALGDALIVAYSGQSHFSAGNNWQVVRRRLDGEPAVIEAFEGIVAAAAALPAALESGDLPRVGELMSQDWVHRRQLAPEVSTPTVEALIEAAQAAGAWGAKVCGAGGGGCLAILTDPARRDLVAAALETQGATVLDARPAAEPLEVRTSSH